MATTLLQSCFHNNPSVNLVLTFITVIQCLSIHLHSFAAAPTLILSQLCILPLFFFFFSKLDSPHSVILFLSFLLSTCVGVALPLLHKQSIPLHSLMSYFKGQSVRVHSTSREHASSFDSGSWQACSCLLQSCRAAGADQPELTFQQKIFCLLSTVEKKKKKKTGEVQVSWEILTVISFFFIYTPLCERVFHVLMGTCIKMCLSICHVS